MVDVESYVFTHVSGVLRARFPDRFPLSGKAGSVSGEYVRAPSAFPHVSIVETDNYITRSHMDSADTERFSTVMYEVNVYSNLTGGKKRECKDIMSAIDEAMYFLNFTRLSLTPVPNLEDATIYRVTARYRAEVGRRVEVHDDTGEKTPKETERITFYRI